MSEWQTVAIGEICDLVTSGGTPLTSQKSITIMAVFLG